MCGQKKIKNFSVNTSAEVNASSNTGASNQPLITVGMLERLNGDEKGDAIVSVRGYEPIWAKFTPSYELKDLYFAEGKADLSKREARLFEKGNYVFDIMGGSQTKEEDRQLEAIDRREKEQAEEKPLADVNDLDKQWKAKVAEVHQKVLRTAEALMEADAAALLKAKLEDKLTLIRLCINNYDISVQQKLQALIKYLEQELPKLLELQEKAKTH